MLKVIKEEYLILKNNLMEVKYQWVKYYISHLEHKDWEITKLELLYMKKSIFKSTPIILTWEKLIPVLLLLSEEDKADLIDSIL
jgi:hypothetical protein